jgi:hypothetical protein
MSLSAEIALPLLILAAIGGALWLRDRWISRQMHVRRVEQLLEEWARLERARRSADGRFRHRSIWNQPR